MDKNIIIKNRTQLNRINICTINPKYFFDFTIWSYFTFKKINPKRLGLRILVGSIGPSAAEGQRARFDFVPRQGHGDWCRCCK